MSEFWMSYEMIARRYGPGYQGYPLFGAVHLGELEAVAVCILLTARWYRRSPERTRRRILWGVTVLLLADEAVLVIAMLATGQWNWSYLPLHLCSIHIFLCTTCTLTGKDWCKEELYALCAPGAAIALLCPGWLGTKAWSLINLHSVTLHGLLVLYPVLLVAGGFRPQVRRGCICHGIFIEKNRSNLIWLLFVKNYDTLKMLSEMAARHCIQRQAVRLFIPLKRG